VLILKSAACSASAIKARATLSSIEVDRKVLIEMRKPIFFFIVIFHVRE
jgi:hypothetical protein